MTRNLTTVTVPKGLSKMYQKLYEKMPWIAENFSKFCAEAVRRYEIEFLKIASKQTEKS